MPAQWADLSDIVWMMPQPLLEVRRLVTSQFADRAWSIALAPLPFEFLDQDLPLRAGDVAAILTKNGTPVPLTEPIRGRTVRAYLEALERGLQKPLKPGDRGRGPAGAHEDDEYSYTFSGSQPNDAGPETLNDKNAYVYGEIAKFRDSTQRLRLATKYETGTLCPYHLLGDSRFFEGAERWGTTNVIVYHAGS